MCSSDLDYPYEDFQDLYVQAWQSKLKGLATYRPNKILGAVLSVTPESPAPIQKQPQDVELDHANRRLSIQSLPAPVLTSLVWPNRPDLPEGNLAWTYMIRHPGGDFALFVGHIEKGSRSFPFEAWVNGSEQPRGLGAVAKTLSMDMRADDRAWLKRKLEVLATTPGEASFEMPFPPLGERKLMPSVVAGVARVIAWRCEQLGALDERAPDLLSPEGRPHPLLDAMFSVEEPRTGTDGTLSWTVDIRNPATG